MNHTFIRHFIKIPFIIKGIDFIDSHSIFRDDTVESSIPDYLKIKSLLLFVINVINLLEV